MVRETTTGARLLENRSLPLGTLLALLVFATMIAFAGTAAADHGGNRDEVLDKDGERLWVGQTVLYEEGSHPNDDGTGSLYRVRNSNTGDVVSEIGEDSAGHILFDTQKLGTGAYQLLSPQGENLFTFEVRNRFVLNTTGNLFTKLREEPGEVTPQTVVEGLRVSLQAEDGTSADYNLYGAFLQNGDLVRDGFSSPFTAEAGRDNSVPLDCNGGTGIEPPCSVLGDFLNAANGETPYSLYLPNRSVFENASFSPEGPQRFPDSLRTSLKSASQDGPVLFLASTGATPEVRSGVRSRPLVVAPKNVNLGVDWDRFTPLPIVTAEYIEINQAVQKKVLKIPPSGQSRSYGPDSVRILPNKDTVVRYYLMTAGRRGRSISVGSAPDLRVTVQRAGSVVRTFTISPNTGQSSIFAPPDPLFTPPRTPTSGAREDLVREMRSDASRTLNYVIPETSIRKPAPGYSMSLEMELVQSSSRSFSEGGKVGTIVCCRSVLGYNAVPVDPPGRRGAPSRTQIRDNILDYMRKSYPISELSVDWRTTLNWDGNSLKKDLKQAYSGRGISGADYSVLQGIRPRPYNVGNAWCPGQISQTGLDGNVAAQEVGHSLDLEHISSTHNTGGGGNEPTPYRHGVIGEFDLSGSTHETAPGKWGNAGIIAEQTGSNWDVSVIPAGDPDSGSAFDHVHEFMSYGGSPRGSIPQIRRLSNIQNGNGAWISDTIYERLFTHIAINRPWKCSGKDKTITRSASASGTSSASVDSAQSGSDQMVDALVFTVTANKTGFQEPQLIRKPIPRSQLQDAEGQEGEYTVELQDAGGNVLLSRSFDLLEGTGSLQGKELDRKLGQVAVPFKSGIERIVVLQDGGVVAEREASPSAPEVRVLTPNGGETWGPSTQTVRWEVSDPDGEQPGVLIEYSPDGGKSWEPLGIFDPAPSEAAGHLPEGNSIEVNVSELEPGAEGLIRVAATDGVNTAQDRSNETFTINTEDDTGGSVGNIRTSLSDTDGDDLPDQVQVEVTVSDVGSGQTTVRLAETEFDMDVSPTNTDQAQFVTPKDPDGDGTNESVEFVSLGPVSSSTYTVVADLSNQAIGEAGIVSVELGDGTTSSTTFTVQEGSLGLNNPFGDSNGNPVSRRTVINRVVQWNSNGKIGGTSYTRSEIIDFVVKWNQAS